MKMKKVLAIGLSLAMLLGLAACGSPDSGEPSTSGTNTEPATEVSAPESTPTEGEEGTDKEESAASAEDVSLTMWTFPFGTDEQSAEERANYEAMAAEFEASTERPRC